MQIWDLSLFCDHPYHDSDHHLNQAIFFLSQTSEFRIIQADIRQGSMYSFCSHFMKAYNWVLLRAGFSITRFSAFILMESTFLCQRWQHIWQRNGMGGCSGNILSWCVDWESGSEFRLPFFLPIYFVFLCAWHILQLLLSIFSMSFFLWVQASNCGQQCESCYRQNVISEATAR